MRVLVIFTGGTIGCLPPTEDHILDVPATEPSDVFSPYTEPTAVEPFGAGQANRYLLIEYYLSHTRCVAPVQFDTAQPFSTLSENMTIEKWNALLKLFQDIDFAEYDGIVVAHGSDTMAYTASLFGLILSGIHIPVVFTGCLKPLSDPRTDGHRNFADAVDFIRSADLCGTYVIVDSIVYLGTRIKQANHFTDKYDTTDGRTFGHMRDGVFVESFGTAEMPWKAGDKRISSLADGTEGGKMGERLPVLRQLDALSDCVLQIRPYVGLNYDAFRLLDSCRAVLHETFHLFTACAHSESLRSSILAFALRCKEESKPLYAAPFSGALLREEGSAQYSSTAAMLAAGVRPVRDMSLEAAYAKLLLAYSIYEDDDDIKRFLHEPLFFEHIITER